MRIIKSKKFKKDITFGLTIILWIVTVWLLYPLINLDSIDMENAKEYLYRSAFGISIMIIFFGKTILDLFFPQVTLSKAPLINTIFLSIYSFLLAGGIIFMITRVILLFLRSRKSGFLFWYINFSWLFIIIDVKKRMVLLFFLLDGSKSKEVSR